MGLVWSLVMMIISWVIPVQWEPMTCSSSKEGVNWWENFSLSVCVSLFLQLCSTGGSEVWRQGGWCTQQCLDLLFTTVQFGFGSWGQVPYHSDLFFKLINCHLESFSDLIEVNLCLSSRGVRGLELQPGVWETWGQFFSLTGCLLDLGQVS